jgi:hypothetical protein
MISQCDASFNNNTIFPTITKLHNVNKWCEWLKLQKPGCQLNKEHSFTCTHHLLTSSERAEESSTSRHNATLPNIVVTNHLPNYLPKLSEWNENIAYACSLRAQNDYGVFWRRWKMLSKNTVHSWLLRCMY